MNQKKTIIILILVLAVGIVGLTIAYFSNSSTVNNVFTTQPYGTTVTEEFTSPSNWLPGSEVEKLVIATNTGNVDEAVRISLSESWVTANGGTLNGWITSTGTKSSHLPENEPSTDERVAIINFDNQGDWTYNNGYYYYNYKLSSNESTSSLIKSVTFNEKIKLDDTCVETPTATGRTITCNSSSDDYDNATYTLTFNIETVQYNKYKEAWNTNYNIAESKPVATVCSYEIGDEITYDDENYYVIHNSDSTVDYVVALKKELLTAEEVNTYSTDYVSQNGEYPYCVSDTNCSDDYSTSSIKKLLDNWSEKYSNDLVIVDQYKVRNILWSEIQNLMVDENVPSFIIIDGKEYWTNSSMFSGCVVFIESTHFGSCNMITNKYSVRPVINLKKSAIESACPTH